MSQAVILKNIGMKFGDFWALKDINAMIFPRKITAFVGPNGAGKTTLFNIISGQINPTEGKVFLGGKDITGSEPCEISNLGIGRLFQDLRIFKKLSALENIEAALISPKEANLTRAFLNFIEKGNKNEHKDEAYRWLEFVELKDQANKLAENLSFGQQKLLAIARLLAGGYEILLLDEPTSGISPKIMKKILDLIVKIVEGGKTIAVIEHNMSAVKEIAYWTHFLNEGKLGFTGKTEHVLGNKKIREIYIGL